MEWEEKRKKTKWQKKTEKEKVFSMNDVGFVFYSVKKRRTTTSKESFVGKESRREKRALIKFCLQRYQPASFAFFGGKRTRFFSSSLKKEERKEKIFECKFVCVSFHLTTTTRWLNWFSRGIDIDLIRCFRARCTLNRWNTRFDFSGHRHKCLFNIRRTLRRCF